MRDTAGLIKTEKQFERLLNLCARELGTINKFISIGLIADIGDGKFKVKVMYRNYYLYAMIYDGKRITDCARLVKPAEISLSTGILSRFKNFFEITKKILKKCLTFHYRS